MLWRIFRPKMDEIIGRWWKLYREELHYLNPSPNIIRIIKTRRIRWAGYVTQMGENMNVYRVLRGKPEERDH
jgi:hypothetical protein